MNSPCENCGLCCMEMGSPPVDLDFSAKPFPAILNMPKRRIAEIESYLDSPRHNDGQPCIWLDLASGECRHYKDRPSVCREFEPGCDACNTMREERGLPAICGGCAGKEQA